MTSLILDDFVSRLQPGDGVIDIGCNTGVYTVKFAEAVGPTGCVLAVDPGAEAVAEARTACKAHRHVRVLPRVIGPSIGEALVFHDSLNSQQHSMYLANVPAHKGTTSVVPMVSLDSIAASVPKLRAIKVDTQGAECDVLAGATETLTRENVLWCVEIWAYGLKQAGASVADLARRFTEAGYHPLAYSWEQVIEMAERKGQWSAFDALIGWSGRV